MESQRALCSPLGKRMIYGVSRPSPNVSAGNGTLSRSDFRWDKRRGVYVCRTTRYYAQQVPSMTATHSAIALLNSTAMSALSKPTVAPTRRRVRRGRCRQARPRALDTLRISAPIITLGLDPLILRFPPRGVLRRLHLLQTLHKRADSAACKRSRLKVAVSNAT